VHPAAFSLSPPRLASQQTTVVCRCCSPHGEDFVSHRACYLATALQVQRLPGWFKQRDNYFYPAWAYVYPTTVLRMPYSLLVAVLWSCIVYYPVGLAPEASRCERGFATSSPSRSLRWSV